MSFHININDRFLWRIKINKMSEAVECLALFSQGNYSVATAMLDQAKEHFAERIALTEDGKIDGRTAFSSRGQLRHDDVVIRLLIDEAIELSKKHR